MFSGTFQLTCTLVGTVVSYSANRIHGCYLASLWEDGPGAFHCHLFETRIKTMGIHQSRVTSVHGASLLKSALLTSLYVRLIYYHSSICLNRTMHPLRSRVASSQCVPTTYTQTERERTVVAATITHSWSTNRSPLLFKDARLALL